MRLYATRDAFEANLGHVRKWMRAGEAVVKAPGLPYDAAYSLGDSLTFWRARDQDLTADGFVGHRRYHGVLAPLEGNLRVRIAAKAGLTVDQIYDDTTDRETFMDGGEGESVVVPEGGVLILEEPEAAHVEAGQSGSAVVLHVTVEGFTFPNK